DVRKAVQSSAEERRGQWKCLRFKISSEKKARLEKQTRHCRQKELEGNPDLVPRARMRLAEALAREALNGAPITRVFSTVGTTFDTLLWALVQERGVPKRRVRANT
ncbi:hypothetical protein, partial [Mesorhizobium sp. M4B.F.Ca.ET.089.01.1.1]|uniref:hypothetical protein n=1 Tax=Mesorhizobium sp. M4B.F.Ca.ET.089.01.1.1 TaxID=2496662 RepID=UPI001AECD32E